MSSEGPEYMQQTLSGGEQLPGTIEELRERPGTFRWCHECEDWVLRSRWNPHDEHDWRAQKADADRDDGGDGDDEEEEEAERAGAWYDIRLSYSVDYAFRVPAWNEHQAEDLAKEWVYDAKPADHMHVHTDRREIEEIWEDDPALPDDYDLYGSERLYDAIQRAKEEDGDE